MTQQPGYWGGWYLAGQCCRFLGDIDGAVKYLSRAAALASAEAPVFLALGIAYQLREKWNEAAEALLRAIEIDPDYALAYNSLALTQKKSGELDKALHNYDAAAQALGRRIAKRMQNSRANPILKHREEGEMLWRSYALRAALYRCALDDQSGISWPTSEQAAEEERTEKHAGLYWTEIAGAGGNAERFFLPNYFNTFRALLGQDLQYSKLMGNRGVVLELLGRQDEARQHYAEAEAFSESA
jgi:tetratricopeptide (TPR) repeat protein